MNLAMEKATQNRLIDEERELGSKIGKLKDFLVSETCVDIPQVDRRDLVEQLTHMEAYHKVLMRRISRQCNNA